MLQMHPITKFSIAIGNPQKISQITFAKNEGAPPPYSISFPNGAKAKEANLKHCNPRGIPIIVMQHKTPAIIQESPLKKPPKIKILINLFTNCNLLWYNKLY